MSGRTTTSQPSAPRRAAESSLTTPVQYLKGVGPARALALARLGIETVEDLLYDVPRRHEDRRHLVPLADLAHGAEQTVEATVAAVSEHRPRRGMVVTKAALIDGSGVAYAVWFNQPYIKQHLRRGMRGLFFGRADRRRGEVQIHAPEFELLDDGSLPATDAVGGQPRDEETWHTGRLVPIYASTEGLTQRVLRTLVRTALREHAAAVPDIIPLSIRQAWQFPPVSDALWALHFPETEEAQRRGRDRLAFEELLALQVGLLLRRRAAREAEKAFRHDDGAEGLAGDHPSAREGLVTRFLESLPFPLTQAQRRAIEEIRADMYGSHPMNRLLQGDVGSGKTAVAIAAMLTCVQGGHQAALMAPTEILAEQHALTMRQMVEPLGVEVALLVGGRRARQRADAREMLRRGSAPLAVGTHALIEDEVAFDRLALVVVDEQHKFGVMQRARLRRKGRAPDVLVMTATPIPRTMALTLYGDLDVTVIDELPPGRSPVVTHRRPASARPKVYAFVREQIARGRQAYVVCPLIEDSEKLQAQAAVTLAEELRATFLAGLRVALLHGRMPADEKDRLMDALRRGEIDVLVATTVIEVGIDVPNATVMVVESADRFGLAQLHQLRGRVGRGAHRSHCILIASPATPEGRRRMEVLTATSDGFRIAQEDLLLRGPGEIMGIRQHGLPDLHVADLAADAALLEEARRRAAEALARDPDLEEPEHRALRAAVRRRFAGATPASVS